jgi:hypothetical protein
VATFLVAKRHAGRHAYVNHFFRIFLIVQEIRLFALITDVMKFADSLQQALPHIPWYFGSLAAFQQTSARSLLSENFPQLDERGVAKQYLSQFFEKLQLILFPFSIYQFSRSKIFFYYNSILYTKVKKFMIIARVPRLEPEACRGF